MKHSIGHRTGEFFPRTKFSPTLLFYKKVKEDFITLGKNSVIYGIGTVVTKSFGLITLPIFTSFLSREEYGVLAMLALLTMVIEPIFGLGISVAMGPLYFEEKELAGKSKTIWSAFTIHVFSCTILVALVCLFPGFLAQAVNLDIKYSSFVIVSLLGSSFAIASSSFVMRTQFEKQSKLFVLLTITCALISIGLSLYFVVILESGALGILYGQMIGKLFNLVGFMTVGLMKTIPSVNLGTMNNLCRLGVPYVPSFFFLFLLMHANKYILEWEYGLTVVGLYSIGFSVGTLFSVITGSISTAWYPFFMSFMGKPEETVEVFGKIFTYYFIFIGIICSAFFIFAKPLVTILTNESFHESHCVVGLVALSYFMQMVFNFFLPSLYFNKTIKYITIVQAITTFISLPITFILIQKFSLLGAAIGLFIGNLIMSIMLYLLNIYKGYKQPHYEWNNIYKTVFIFISIVSINYLLNIGHFWYDVLKMTILWVTASWLAVNILKPADWAYLISRFKNG